MSVRADKVQVSVEIDANKGISELGRLEMIQKDLVKSLANMKKEAAGYQEKALELDKVNTLLDEQREKLGLVGMSMKQLKTYLGELTKQQNSATFGTQQWDELQHKIEDVTTAIKQQENAKKGITPLVNPQDITNLDQLQEMQAKLTQQLRGMGEASKQYQTTYKQLDDVNAQLRKHREELGIAGMTLQQLKNHYKDLEQQIESMPTGSEAYEKMRNQMQQVDGAIQTQTNSIKGLGGMWQWLKGEVAQMGMLAVGIMAVQAAWEKVQQVIQSNADLADSFSDIEKATGMSAQAVESFNDQLRKIDTRTKSADLRDIAVIGGQLGVANGELMSFVENVDKAVVALGDEFQGGAEEVAKELGSLQKLFKETATMDAGEAINDIGSAVNALGAAGSATGPVVADFAKRVGALGELGPNISQTLGLGAALQELGLSAEQSSGGITNVILQMNKEADSFAKFMDMGVEKFKGLMHNNPNDMLLQMAERFKGASSTSIVQTMEALGINSQEAVKVVALLAEKTDMVREKQELANTAMQQGTSLTEEFSKKNENFAAKLDKLGKLLAHSFVNSGIKKGMEAIVDSLISMTKAAKGSEDAFKKWETQAAVVERLSGGFEDLLTEYDNLSFKTNRTEEENRRLEKVMQQIAETVPQAVSAWDSYGKAMSINTGLARALREEQELLAKEMNKTALAEKEKELEEKVNELNRLSKTVELGKTQVTRTMGNGMQRITERDATAEEIQANTARLGQLQAGIRTIELQIQKLSGEKTTAELELEQAATPWETPTNLKTPPKATGKGKAKAAPKAPKTKEDWEVDVQRPLQEYQKWYDAFWDAHTANIADQYDREKAIAERNFKEKLKTLAGNEQQQAMLEIELRKQLDAQLEKIEDERQKAEEEKQRQQFQARADQLRAGAQTEVIRTGMDLEANPNNSDAREKFQAAQIRQIELDAELRIQELENVKGTEEEKELIIAESEEAIAQVRAQFRDQEKEAMINAAEQFADVMLNMINALSSFAQSAAEADMQRVENRKNAALSALDEEYSSGTMRKARYEKEKEKIEKQAEERIRKIKNDQAKKDREAQIAQTIIQGSIAVLSASQNPLGIMAPQAIATSIAAGLQLATVIAQPLPQYAEGGLTGKSIAAGGYQNSGPFIATMNEQGVEYVIPNYLLKDPVVADYVALIESMRSGNHYGGRYAEGGLGPGNRSPLLASASQGAIQGSATDLALLEAVSRLNAHLENPRPAQAIFDYDYWSRSTQEIEQVKKDAIAA